MEYRGTRGDRTLSLTPELYDLIVKIVDDRVRGIKVTREEFDKLRRSMEEGFERLENAITRLAEAQRRTEGRVSRLEDAVMRLAEAQRRTEERLNALAEAQRRTEERVNALAEAQRRTEERVSKLEDAVMRLAEAQRRTEDAVRKLAIGMNALRREVGRLSDTIGFGLEDIARVVLPGWLHRHLGVEVDELRREFLTIDGREVEVDLYGEGLLKGERVIIVGEVKSRIYEAQVDKFYRDVYAPLSKRAGVRVIGLLFGYLIHPSAKERAKKLGLYTIVSYER